MTHFLVMMLFAALIALVFGVIGGRQKPRDGILYGLKIFGEFIGVGLGLAWLLYFIPR